MAIQGDQTLTFSRESNEKSLRNYVTLKPDEFAVTAIWHIKLAFCTCLLLNLHNSESGLCLTSFSKEYNALVTLCVKFELRILAVLNLH